MVRCHPERELILILDIQTPPGKIFWTPRNLPTKHQTHLRYDWIFRDKYHFWGNAFNGSEPLNWKGADCGMTYTLSETYMAP